MILDNGSKIELDNYTSKDKIKSQITKLKEEPDSNKLITSSQAKLNTIIILENLLEE